MVRNAISGFRFDISFHQAIGVIVAIGIVGWAVFVESSVFPNQVQDVFAIFGFALVLWLTKAVPYVISGSATIVLLDILGVAPSFEAAASGFASTLVFFLLLVFLLGGAIATVDLDHWVASRLTSTETRSRHPVEELAIHLFALAFLMPSAVARAATFVPVVGQLADSTAVDTGDGFEHSAFLILGHVNPIASMALMTGGGMAIVTSEIVRSAGYDVTWAEWAVFMIPPVAILYGLSAVTAGYLYGGHPDVDDSLPHNRAEKSERGTLQALSGEQRLVGLTMLGAVLLWVLGSFIGLPAIVPAILAVGVLSLPGIRIITAEDVSEVSWGILFVVGAMFSLLEQMEATGALRYIVDALTGAVPFSALAHWQIIAVLLVLAVCVRTIFSTGSAAILVALPVLLRIGETLHVNQLYLALAVLLVVGSTTIFPFNTTSVLLSMEHGPLTGTDVLAFGLVTMAYSVLVVTLAWVVYWPAVATAVSVP